MKKRANIHGLDSLEKEIYRLRIKASGTEKKLDDNISWLRKNASAVFFHTFFTGKKEKKEDTRKKEEGFFKNDRLNGMINNIADRITDRAAENIDSLVGRIFRKRSHRSSK